MTGEENLRKGPWYEEEDEKLKAFVADLGERRWDSIARASGLKRSGKSCRLRWLNYLRPCLKKGPITSEEERVILQLHEKWGNKWAKIARRLPGRTDNEIKNYWRTRIRKKMQIQNLLHCSPFSTSYNVSSVETSSSSSQTSSSNQDDNTTTNQEIRSNNNDNNEVIVGPSCFDINSKGLSDFNTITSSPYENGLSDWMTTCSSKSSDQELLSTLGLCFDDYPSTNWSLGDSNISDTLWDLDLFTINL